MLVSGRVVALQKWVSSTPSPHLSTMHQPPRNRKCGFGTYTWADGILLLTVVVCSGAHGIRTVVDVLSLQAVGTFVD